MYRPVWGHVVTCMRQHTPSFYVWHVLSVTLMYHISVSCADGKMRHHVRKTTRAAYSKEQMKLAVAGVIESGLSVRESARVHDVNYKSLGRYVKLQQMTGEISHVGYKTVRQVFTVEIEQLLVDYIKKAAQIYHGLTPKNIRELAFKLAQSNNLTMPPTWTQQQIAGVDWFACFMRRHSNLSIQEPEPTSLARMTNFNRATFLKL
jgi:transposase-like protein